MAVHAHTLINAASFLQQHLPMHVHSSKQIQIFFFVCFNIALKAAIGKNTLHAYFFFFCQREHKSRTHLVRLLCFNDCSKLELGEKKKFFSDASAAFDCSEQF